MKFWPIFFLVLPLALVRPSGTSETGGRMVNDIGDALITSFAQTDEGYIWISTMGDGLFLFDGTSYIQYLTESGLSSKFQTSLWTDADGRLWIGTQQGVDRYDLSSDRFVHYEIKAQNRYVIGFTGDPTGGIYAFTRSSLFKLDDREGVFVPVMDLSSGRGFNTSIWFDSEGGLHVSEDDWEEIYDSSFRLFRREENIRSASLPPGVNLQFRDRDGNVWSALEEGGYRVDYRTVFREGPFSAFYSACAGNKITSFSQGNGFIWAILNERDIVVSGKDSTAVLPVCEILGRNDISSFRVQYVREGKLLLSGSHYAFFCSYGKDGVPVLECTYVCEDDFPDFRAVMTGDGQVWAGNVGTVLYRGRPASGSDRIITLEKAGEVNPDMHVNTSAAGMMRDGKVIVCFADLGPVVVDPSSGKFRTVPLPGLDGQVYIYGFFEDRDGLVWFYSSDKGVFVWDPTTDDVRSIKSFEGADVFDVAQDLSGRMYILSESVLYSYDLSTDETEVLWQNPSAHYHDDMLFSLPDGSIVLRSANRLFHPSRLRTSAKESLDVGIHLVISTDGKVILNCSSAALSEEKLKVVLPLDPGEVKLHLSVIGGGPGNFYYNHLLMKNRHSDWISSAEGTDFPLYGLRFGNTEIRFKVSDRSTGASSGEYSFTIRRPVPWYISVTMAGIPILVIVLGSLLMSIRRRKKEREAHLADIDFFANMSHEFRAPLTLIVGASSSIGNGAPLSGEQNRMLQVIRRNTDRMLKLVSQMLDFNKLDHGMMELHVKFQDVSPLIKGVAALFQVGAGQKNIDLSVEGVDFPVHAWVDADKLEKMLYNLCSNALKFTPASGRVVLSLEVKDPGRLMIRVSDTGIGIPEDQLENVFRRFAQLDSAHKSGGTGVGLYYTRSLAQLHHGRIWAENRPGGTGSVFTIELPISEDAYSPSEREADDDVRVSADPVQNQSEYIVQEAPGEGSKPTAVVIDDDYELVYYIRSLLSDDYEVMFRFDAMSGYALIEKEQPDIVICDVMMVDVDGFELCRLVKENLSICHIPVILLTGRSTLEDQVTGLGAGADAYVTKPFKPEYLKALLAATVQNRRRIQNLVRESTHTDSMPEAELSPRDKAFMDKLYAQMESSLSEEGLDINTVADSLGIGRTKFYAKVKALTGQTPNGFFNVYKLNRAAELIRDGKYKISAIANMVGFSSASHFSTVFRKQFGVLPSQYADRESPRYD